MKSKTTRVAVVMVVMGAGLLVATALGKMSGSEFQAAITGVVALGTFLIGVYAKDHDKE
jgi:hypothetical protein